MKREEGTGPVALVTGGSRGIGRAAVMALAAAGYRVGVVARSVEAVGETVAAVRATGGEAEGLVADVADPSACERVVTECVGRFGRLDALVHAAGLAPVRAIEAMSVAEWREVVDVNLSGAFYLMKFAWGELRK